MIVLAAILVTAIIATALYAGLQLYTYYLVDGIARAVETIEEPYLEGADRD